MQLELTEEDYAKLIRMTYLASWMVEAHQVDDQNDLKEVEQKIFSLAQGTKQKDLIEYDEKLKSYFPTVLLDDDPFISQVIEQYDEDCFWDELLDRLTKKEMLDTYGEKAISEMTLDERIEKENKFMAKYEKEFETNGLRNFRIDS